MNRSIALSALLLACTTVSGTTWTITSAGSTFNPNSVTITDDDDVNFVLDGSHNAREVTLATWNANGTTALPGGFETPFGGGAVSASQLSPGTHYYVCTSHASLGMKGQIIVQSTTGIENNQFNAETSVFPNPSYGLITFVRSNIKSGTGYSIIDRNGREVLKGTFNSEPLSIDISQLATGIYFFRIEGDRRKTYKIIKN